MKSLRTLLAAMLCSLMFGGCTFLSGAGSMRIEVEVYKGPLSKEPAMQWAELTGLLEEAHNLALNAHETACAFVSMEKIGSIEFAACQRPFPGMNSEAIKTSLSALAGQYGKLADQGNCKECRQAELALLSRIEIWQRYIAINTFAPASTGRGVSVFCDGLKPELRGTAARVAAMDACRIVSQVLDDTRRLVTELLLVQNQISSKGELKPLPRNIPPAAKAGQSVPQLADKEFYTQVLQSIGRLSMQLKSNAQYWGYQVAVGNPADRSLRYFTAGFAQLTSELGNQFGSRADALLKQLEGDNRRFLAPSVYLRDSQPTDFVNLPAWKRAAPFALPEDLFLHPVASSSSTETTDRIRVYERLYSDNYWSNINTVYASGQGEVSMAFVKDDIGNWNLKQFDNDPTALLQAYKSAGLGLLKEVTKLASGPVGGTAAVAGQLGTAGKLVDLSNRLALGKSAQSENGAATGVNVGALNQRTVNRLRAVRAKIKAENEHLAKLEGEADPTQKPTDDEEVSLDACPDKLAKGTWVQWNAKIRKSSNALTDNTVRRAQADAIEKWESEPKAIAEDARANVEQLDANFKEPEDKERVGCQALDKVRRSKAFYVKRLDYAEALQRTKTTYPAEVRMKIKTILEEHSATLDALSETMMPAEGEGSPSDSESPKPDASAQNSAVEKVAKAVTRKP